MFESGQMPRRDTIQLIKQGHGAIRNILLNKKILNGWASTTEKRGQPLYAGLEEEWY